MKKIIFFALISSFFISNLYGIPAFARKYSYSCSTCHVLFPKLKDFGDEFAGNGFRLSDLKEEPPRAKIDTGDPNLFLLRDFPIAVRLDGFLVKKEKRDAKWDNQVPYVFKILSGGYLGKNFSYYFYYILEKGEAGKLEDAYIQWSNFLGIPVDLIFGQYQICDPIVKRELRLERQDYEIYKLKVGRSPISLSYDRGLSFSFKFIKDTDLIFTLTNGNGIDEADEEENFDDNDFKNLSLRVAKSFGNLNLGIFGYFGKDELGSAIDNKTTYFGPDLNINLGKFEINSGYLLRKDTNPFFIEDGEEIKTKGGFFEFHYFIKEKTALSILYNKIESDLEDYNLEGVSFTLNHLFLTNFKVLFEYFRDLEKKRNEISLGFSTAF